MKMKTTMPYKLKRMIPAFALAGASMFSACESPNGPITPDFPPKPDTTTTITPDTTTSKPDTTVTPPEPQPYVKVFEFDESGIPDSYEDSTNKYLADPLVEKIVYHVRDNNNFTSYTSADIELLKSSISYFFSVCAGHKKAHGSGDFWFAPKAAYPGDSIWFIDRGFTVNQRQR